MKKLAIVGMAAGFEKAPWRKPGWECWTLNSAWKRFENEGLMEMDEHTGLARYPVNLTAWFELHSRRYLTEEWHGSMQHFRMLARLRCPIYVQHPKDWPHWQNPQSFPRAAIVRQFARGDYHASSLDWMLAFAVFQGYTHVEMFGVNLAPNEGQEPMSGRAALEYWIGFAEGRGVKVTVHEPTGVFWIYNVTKEKTPYHYDDTWRLIEKR